MTLKCNFVDMLLVHKTEPGKTGLITHVSRLDFSPRTQI